MGAVLFLCVWLCDLYVREHGPELWEMRHAVVSEQITNGQSVAAFCKERGVTSKCR
jgi:hypothetical protein